MNSRKRGHQLKVTNNFGKAAEAESCKGIVDVRQKIYVLRNMQEICEKF